VHRRRRPSGHVAQPRRAEAESPRSRRGHRRQRRLLHAAHLSGGDRGQVSDQIAEELARDAAAQRLGAFGEIGQQGGVLTDDEKKVFQAVAKAHLRSGCRCSPTRVHRHEADAESGAARLGTAPARCPRRRGSEAVSPRDSAHLRLDDPKARSRSNSPSAARRRFDRVTIRRSDAERVVMIMAMVEAGYVDHVLLSSDFASSPGR